MSVSLASGVIICRKRCSLGSWVVGIHSCEFAPLLTSKEASFWVRVSVRVLGSTKQWLRETQLKREWESEDRRHTYTDRDTQIDTQTLLCNRTTLNRSLNCQFDHTWFFPALLWSWDFAPASGKLLWTLHTCDSAFATWSMETGEISSSIQMNDTKRFSQLNDSGMVLAWTPIHNNTQAHR